MSGASADQAVDPMEGLRRADEGRVVLDHHERAIGEGRVRGARREHGEGVLSDEPSRTRHRRVERHVERQNVGARSLDDFRWFWPHALVSANAARGPSMALRHASGDA